LLKTNSKIKYEESFYFFDDLYDWNDYFRDYFSDFFISFEEIVNSNENYIDQTIDVTNIVDELHEYLNI